MRLPILIGLVAGASACGGSSGSSPDTQTGNYPPPRMIAGGGIGDGAVDGVVNLYVIDDASRAPVVGAMVQVGTLGGMTDSTGLFVASGVHGPQTVAVKATNYRSEMWIGANGANMTIDLSPAIDPVPTSANLSGAIIGFDAITVPAGHHKAAIVTYSQNDKLGDAANTIPTMNNTNICDTAQPTGGCTFTVTSRTGSVGLVAAIYDHNVLVTPQTFTLIGWASRMGITVANGVGQAGQDLTMVDSTNIANVSVSFGNPPSGLTAVGGIVGLDVGAAGTLQLPQLLTPTTSMILAPKPSAFAGSTYRFTGIATNQVGQAPATAQSVVLVRGQTSTALAAGAWLGVPSGLSLTRTGGSWTAVAGALIQSASYDQTSPASTAVTHLLNLTTFDGSTSFTIPDVVALPGTGTLTGKGTAIAATLDLTNFSLDADKDKITAASSQSMAVN